MLNGYTAFSLLGKRRSRYGRNPGGITVLISDRVNKSIRCINVTDYAIYLIRFDKSHFDTFDKDIMVVCLYIPCDGSSFHQKRVKSNGIREFMDEFIDTISTECSMALLHVGDFNARTGNAPDYVIDANNQHIDIPEWLHD